MFSCTNAYDYIPCKWIGQDIAIYIQHASLNDKIANAVDAIFLGLIFFAYYQYALPIWFSVSVSTNISIVNSVLQSSILWCFAIINKGDVLRNSENK